MCTHFQESYGHGGRGDLPKELMNAKQTLVFTNELLHTIMQIAPVIQQF